jgi:DNA-binding XRE family transcriptional regulator
MTATELAERAGVGRPHPYGIEAGDRSPTIVVVVKLAHAMNTTASALFHSLN